MGGGRVVEVHDASEWHRIMEESRNAFGVKGVVVDFSATWCGPCQMIGPVFAQLSDHFPTLTFVKVDVDELQEVAQSCKVSAMPTFQAYFNGELVDTLVGADPAKLKSMISSLASRAPVAGSGRRLGGDEGADGTPAAASSSSSGPQDMRARMLAAAEARAKSAAAGGAT